MMKYVMPVWDEGSRREKVIQIEDRSIRYYDKALSQKNIISLDTSTFQVFPGKVTMDTEISEEFLNGHGLSYSKRLLLSGYSAFIHIIDINYERHTNSLLEKSRAALKKCPIDYIFSVRVPLKKLTPSWVRLLKKQSISLICIQLSANESLFEIYWERILEAAFPKRMMFILDSQTTEGNEKDYARICGQWSKLINRFQINSYVDVPIPGEELPLLFLKRLGLYPYKGSFDSGSDADYFMFEVNTEKVDKIPTPAIIVLKGEVIKAGKSWYLHNKTGKEMRSIIPEQFLSIENIHRYQTY